ncbi:hypothetical protein BZA05DRAFT_383242 [Tricharina praecox]|uniref:uncharacterized protein n=1 Tax=Tricharina praecox TaxID=43433 RepID=UPI00221F31A1|nr:uncharacterized protein BZA05DRAFT_383242 [Tricharina praecox]KAI5859062.1 hypothetical protein BZA05DRAFT_383242 [Tricharina praecox]
MSSSSLPTNATTLDPYVVLSVPLTATAAEIRSAYRKLALLRHPDKAPTSSRDAAHVEFQELAFAYSILSDAGRRARYDRTGSTDESVLGGDGDGEEGFDWAEFFAAQYTAVNKDAVEEYKLQYQSSEEEGKDVLKAYVDGKGDLDFVFENVVCSDPLVDEERFRGYIDKAIGAGEVESYVAYRKEGEAKRKRRVRTAKKEAEEAEEAARRLGVHEELFGDKKGKAKGKAGKKDGEEDTAALAALIRGRGANRMDAMIAGLEAKYGGAGKKKRATKRAAAIPTEEEFAATQERVTRKRARKA